MKRIQLGFIVLICLHGLCQQAAFSADQTIYSVSPEERLKQQGIFQSQEAKVLENYTVGRSLQEYTDVFSDSFDQALASLGPKDRWLDIGAGKGHAILDYYSPTYDASHPIGKERRGGKAQAVAISIEDRRTPLWQQTAALLEKNQIRYLFNKRFREYSPDELGTFQIITDMLGGFSYTEDISLFLEKTLALLDLHGTFYTILQDVNSDAGSNRPYYANSPYLTEIADASGKEVKVCAWIKRIACIEVSCELNSQWRPPVEVYRIQKTCNAIAVPHLTPTHFTAGTPPERRFLLEK